jgi:hypothetical protein
LPFLLTPLVALAIAASTSIARHGHSKHTAAGLCYAGIRTVHVTRKRARFGRKFQNKPKNSKRDGSFLAPYREPSISKISVEISTNFFSLDISILAKSNMDRSKYHNPS